MGHDHQQRGNLKLAFFINLGFTVLEIIGGVWTNSIAIISDAVHDLGDSLSLALAWFLDRYSKKGPDKQFSFGYARFSLLGALVNSLVLVGGSAFVLTKAIPRIFAPQEVNPQGMLVFAVLGIVANGIAVLRLKRGSSLNEKVVSWHLMEDVLGWVAVLIVSIVLLFADLPILDPILSVAITIYILFNVGKNLKEILNILLQGVPKDFSIDETEKKLQKEEGLLSVHHTHMWSLEGERILLSTHVRVRDDATQQDLVALKKRLRTLLKEQGIDHVTIEIEFESEVCPSGDCD